MLHQSKNPQHPYYESAKQMQSIIDQKIQSQRLHFSHQPNMSFRERFRVAQLKGHYYAV